MHRRLPTLHCEQDVETFIDSVSDQSQVQVAWDLSNLPSISSGVLC